MGRAESGIQSYVLGRLQALENQHKIYFWRNNSFAGRVTRYNGSQGFINNAKPGMPDVIFATKHVGRMVGVECKSAAGRQTKEQKDCEARFTELGAVYRVIKTPEEFEKLLEDVL